MLFIETKEVEMSRNSAPDAAFAFITKIDGAQHRLLKHHNNKVITSTDNKTIDVELLQCALNILDQIPASEEEKTKIRQHLESHAAVVTTGAQPDDIRDPQHDHGTRQQLEKDERAAREIVGAQNGGPAGNQSITNPRVDEHLVDEPAVTRRAEEQLRQEGGAGSIVGGGSTGVAPGKDNSPANTNLDLQSVREDAPSTDVETVKVGDSGTPPHADSVVSGPEDGNPKADVTHEENLGKPGPEPKSGVPQSGTKKSVADEKSTGGPKAPIANKSVEKTVQKKKIKSKDDSTYAQVGDWVKNDQGFVGVVVRINEKTDNPVVKIPAGHDQAINNIGWQVIVKASEVDVNDPMSILKNEMRILNSSEALVRFGTPTPEGQRARNAKIALCSVENLTEVGKKFLKQKFDNAIAGKAVAKIQSIDKIGSRELIELKLGDDEEFPFFVLLEVFKDNEDKVHAIEIFNDRLHVETFKDIAKFLKDLAKEGPDKSKSATEESVVAGEKLDS